MSPPELEEFLQRSLLRAHRTGALESQAELDIDTTHPFFFDHPLDHVPGLLLLVAMSELAWHCVARAPQAQAAMLYHAQMRARFSKWCLFTPEVQLQARGRDQVPTVVDVQARQDGVLRCESHVKLDKVRTPLRHVTVPRHVAPCDQRMVNKHNIDNVMIGTPSSSDGALHAQILTPGREHALAGPNPDALGTLYLLEAFMQTQRHLNKTVERDAGHRMRDTLCEVSIELHRQVGRTEPVDIVRPLEPAPVQRGLRRHEGTLQVGDETVGRCAIVTLTSL